jgi:hypothetical protein
VLLSCDLLIYLLIYLFIHVSFGSLDSVVIATRLRDGRSRVRIPADRLWDPTSLLLNGYRRFFPGGKVGGRDAKFPVHLNLVPKLRMSGAIPPLPPHACMECVWAILPFIYVSLTTLSVPKLYSAEV